MKGLTIQFCFNFQVASWLEWRQKNKPTKPTLLNSASRPPQSFANLLALNATQPQQYIRASQSAPGTPTKLTGLTTVIRAQAPASVTSRLPIIQQHLQQQQQPRVHIQAGQPAQPQQQSIVLPVRTTPLTTQGGAGTLAVSTALAGHAQSSHQIITTAALPTHTSGTIQTVKIGTGQAQVRLQNINIVLW